ncbi:hypothetical protein [Shewanella sp. MBTL60-007]|nr:hypothetical protein [Shewanella sp. MBTL60-007]
MTSHQNWRAIQGIWMCHEVTHSSGKALLGSDTYRYFHPEREK